MGRHRPADKSTPTATDFLAQLALEAQATKNADASVDVTLIADDRTAEIPRVDGSPRLPPVPVRVRWVAGVAATGLAATSLLVASDLPSADSSAAQAPDPQTLHVEVLTEDEAMLRLAASVAAHKSQEDAQRAAQDVQAAADQAELDRRAAAEEAARQEEARKAAQAAQEAAEAARATGGAHRAPEGSTGVSSTVRGGASAIVPGGRVTSGYGARWGTTHYGVDIAAPLNTPIYSPVSGTVAQAGSASGFGNAIYIRDGNGDVWVFGHMRTMNVSAGDSVAAGDQIALVGNEGQSTGPHVHIEKHLGGINGQKVDPAPSLGL